MDSRALLIRISAGRVLVGLAMVFVPRFMGERWLGAGGTGAETGAMMRVGGIRDAAMGIGAITAARAGMDPRPWHAASVVIDGTDALATARAEGVPQSNKAPAVAVALGIAITSLLALLFARND